MDDNFFEKGKTFLSTATDNCIKFEMNLDDKESVPCFTNIQMDDIHTLVNIVHLKISKLQNKKLFF